MKKPQKVSIALSEKSSIVTGAIIAAYGIGRLFIQNEHPVANMVMAIILLIAVLVPMVFFNAEDNDEFSIQCRGYAGRFAWKFVMITICILTGICILYSFTFRDVCWILIGAGEIAYSAAYLYHERKGA